MVVTMNHAISEKESWLHASWQTEDGGRVFRKGQGYVWKKLTLRCIFTVYLNGVEPKAETLRRMS